MMAHSRNRMEPQMAYAASALARQDLPTSNRGIFDLEEANDTNAVAKLNTAQSSHYRDLGSRS
jgi:hypothetical protein